MSAAIKFTRNSNLFVVVLEKEAYTSDSARVCGGGMWVINSKMNVDLKRFHLSSHFDPDKQ